MTTATTTVGTPPPIPPASATQVSPAEVAAEVIAQGGSVIQAYAAAALVNHVESGGSSTVLSGGIGPAAGLFQFEPTTWQSNGGGAFAQVAQDATWQQQVTVFLNASQGNSFGAWGPDFGYSYGQKAWPPKAGSPVANSIAVLTSGGTLAWLGNVPDAGDLSSGGATEANPVPGPAGDVLGLLTGGTVADKEAAIVGGSLSWTQELGALLADLTSASWWKRVGIFTLGGALVIGGIVLFVSTTKTGEKVTSDATSAAEVAAVA